MNSKHAGIFAANHHCECIVEAERWQDFEIEKPGIFLANFFAHHRRGGDDGLFQNGRQGGACVFDVSVDATGEQGLLADVGAD